MADATAALDGADESGRVTVGSSPTPHAVASRVSVDRAAARRLTRTVCGTEHFFAAVPVPVTSSARSSLRIRQHSVAAWHEMALERLWQRRTVLEMFEQLRGLDLRQHPAVPAHAAFAAHHDKVALRARAEASSQLIAQAGPLGASPGLLVQPAVVHARMLGFCPTAAAATYPHPVVRQPTVGRRAPAPADRRAFAALSLPLTCHQTSLAHSGPDAQRACGNEYPGGSGQA